MPAFAQMISRLCFGLAAASFATLAAQPALAQAASTGFFVT